MIINIKNNIKICFAISFMIAGLVAFTSCDSDPIFSAIEEEVAIDDPNVEGNIYSLALVGDESTGTLFAQNGKIYSKDVTEERGWVEYSTPESNITFIASDGTNLYALAKEDSSDAGTLYYQANASGDWIEVTDLEDNVYNVFDNGLVGSTNRNAYYTIDEDDDGDYQVYLITGLNDSSLTTNAIDYTNYIAADGDRIVKAASLNGTDYFFDSLAFCAADVDDDGTNDFLYKTIDDYEDDDKDEDIEDSTIWYSSNGSDWSESDITATDVDDDDATIIHSLMAYGTDLYFATDYGLGVATIDDTEGELTLSEISDQAETVFDSEGLYGLWEYSDTLYASTLDDDSSENNYLWGCYTTGDDEWNAE